MGRGLFQWALQAPREDSVVALVQTGWKRRGELIQSGCNGADK